MPETAYRVLTENEAIQFKLTGAYAGSDKDKNSGYIHLSDSNQIAKRIDKFAKEGIPVRILEVNLKLVMSLVKWEPAQDGFIYPHLYTTITSDFAQLVEREQLRSIS